VTGVCCTTNGTCTETCQALCIGTFRGVGTSCEPNICRGACCIPTSGCSERTQTSCTQFQGQFRGLGTTCDSLPPHLQCGIGGACCYGGSALTFCQRVDQREFCPFDAFDVTAYRGDRTTCGATSPCGVIGDYRACCLPDGTCVNVPPPPTDATCTAIGVHGEYNASKRCEEFANGCPTVAACCLPDGSCDTLTYSGCLAKGGSQPGPAACGLDTCPTGALAINEDETLAVLVNPDDCDSCASCAEACPAEAITMVEQ
jgi:NAD-dependent dihydropyrimidine dehydrogenase PreA subunit